MQQPGLTIYHLENKICHRLSRQALDHQRQVVGRDVQLIGTTRNLMLGLVMNSSSSIDQVNHKAMQVGKGVLFGQLQGQVLLVSFKELYGYLVIAALASLVLFILYKYPYHPKLTLYPKNRAILRFLKKEIA